MKRFAKIAIAVLVGIPLLLAVWGLTIEPRIIDVEEEPGTLPGLPDPWAGHRIAAIGDLQVGMWGANTGTMRRIVQRLIREPPAAVLLLGDFIYGAGSDASEEIQTVVEILRPLPAAGIPTFAVLGNHDYSVKERGGERDVRQAQQVERALESIGVDVLQNEAARLPGPEGSEAEGGLYIVGIGSEWAEEARPDEALSVVPEDAARIVIMHHPSTFRGLPAREAPVAVAGHTHGGQIRIPGTPSWSWLGLITDGDPHADGWILDPDFGEPGNRLYVNRGIGFSLLPMRINAPPEITLFRLSRQAHPRGGSNP